MPFIRNNSAAGDAGARFLSWSGHLGDIGLATAVMAVVVMMVVPLSPWLVDLLISVNISFSLVILCLSLFIVHPLRFTSFPTLLLVATLYRLALNVSTTRLILLRADAGRIIDGFGGYLVGGDILIGAVIFGILAMVLFLVITKGAERVAEVAARFSLDALPGLQLAIDSDLRAGGISTLDASRKREALDRKSRYYGALDGAMKFVRGDAIASLIITCVNIAGGLSVGIVRHGMSATRAIDTYGRLTVGDGLVTMIPALLVSTAAGFLVTRVGAAGPESRLGDQVARQLVSEPRAMGASAVLLFVLAAVRGLPAWPFLILGSILGGTAVWRFIREHREKLTRTTPSDLQEEWPLKEAVAVVDMGEAIFSELSPAAQRLGSWSGISVTLADGLRRDLGIPLARVPIAASRGLPGRNIRLAIRGISCHSVTVPEERPDLQPIISDIEKGLRERADRLIGLDETQALVHRVARHRPVLVRETVPKLIDLSGLTALLRALLSDGISLSHVGEVLEIISRLPAGAATADLVEQVRAGLSPVITHQLTGGAKALKVVMLASETESVLEGAVVRTGNGARLVLPNEEADLLVRALDKTIRYTDRPVLVVSPPLRRPLARLVSAELPALEVVKATEIESDVSIEVLGRIEI